MEYAVGFIAGVAVSTLAFVILNYLKSPIERSISVAEKRIQSAGPRPRGFVMEPESEAEEARERIVERNRRQGRDTPVSDLE